LRLLAATLVPHASSPFLILPLGAVMACASSPTASDGPDTITGAIRGIPYPVAESISATLSSTRGSQAVIVLSSSRDACTPADAQIAHPGETTLIVIAADVTGTDSHTTEAPGAPGTYPVIDITTQTTPGPRFAFAYTSRLDASCGNPAEDQTSSVSGSLVLTAAHDGVYAGTFDIVLDSADHITGEFHPTACSTLPAIFSGANPRPTCVP
jgi:hypothetical protein